ncbi:MAG TPA: hypothetical protein GX497_01795 [Bacillus bacterium]|nr:hypothetical protein [Bacillus sp. (in: firmicutes)]
MNPKDKLKFIQEPLSIEDMNIAFDEEFATRKGLSPEIIDLIRKKVTEENSKQIKMYDIQSLLFPVIIWATDTLGSYLTSRIVELGIHSFCEKYKEKNELTKVICEK